MSELDVEKQFELDPQLHQDTLVVGRFELSVVLMSRDANYPWCILVPQRAGKYELHHLSEADRQQLIRESCHLSEVMTDLFVPDKMNVAALGNVVRQLHVHHVARFKTDKAWPGPVWGIHPAADYSEADLDERVSRLQRALSGEGFESVCSI